MSAKTSNDLKERIRTEMTVDYSDSIEKNFELAKDFVVITKTGKVDVKVKESLTAEEQISLYLVGKQYAKRAEYAGSSAVTSLELEQELGLKRGTLDPALKSLFDKKLILKEKNGKNTLYSIGLNMIERTLRNVEKKIEKTLKEKANGY